MAGVYDRQAAWWHERRDRSLYEAKWLDAFLDGLPPSPRLLDLGCGTGEPIAAYLRGKGADVTGVDASRPMIDIARRHAPSAAWHVADMRCLAELGPELGTFDGIVSWDAFFHLSVAEQRDVLPDLCARIRPGGAVLLTVGPDEGEVGGAVNAEPVYHASLSPREYREILSEAGFADIRFTPEDPDALGRSVLLASGKAARYRARHERRA